MQEKQPEVAVIGCGYWGKNLVRNFHELGALACVCDVNEDALRAAGEKYHIKTTSDWNEVLDDKRIYAVVIAAPAAQHYALTKQALLSGKDVYVEKPLALRSSEGVELVQLAKDADRILMVGHILEYHPALVELKRLVRSGTLGKIRYLYSSRLNLGKLRTEENILWSFAPHDVSAILSLLNEIPIRVASSGGSYLNSEIYDTTLTTLDFASGVKAHVFVSWLHPFKEQKLAVVGDRNMAVFDDMESENKLTLYPHRIDWLDRLPVALRGEGQAIPLPKQEPLRMECEHFLQCLVQRSLPRTDGKSAVEVLRILEACESSLKEQGQPVEIGVAPEFYCHPTAVVDPPSEIGRGTKVWHFSHVMPRAVIGERCILGQNVLIASGVRIGNNVKIQNNVAVYTGVELEDDVFCGPSMVFTNVINPRSHIVRKNEFKQTLVRRGATLGANSTVVCGTTIGEYAFVGAGAVVTHDVPNYALVLGTPARQVGWMCACGTRLSFNSTAPTAETECCECGAAYELSRGGCRPVTLTVAKTAGD